ncbi:MAG: hypothetical protein Q7J34_03655 [Bacteroidales bacterium]|jgi:hypothetical protein|nr:hypothetical protein [Bacteroidales bacterium]
MRKIVLLFIVFTVNLGAQAQIILTTELVDSLICKISKCPISHELINSRYIIKFVGFADNKNRIFLSETDLINRQDIPEEALIYVNDFDLYFVIIKDVDIDSCFQKRLISQNDIRFVHALDSIKFGQIYISGIVTVRNPLIVYQIKRRCLSRHTFIITSKKYFPYLSAPEIFIPAKKISDDHMYDKIEAWYYDIWGKLNKEYYDAMKPGEKMTLKMRKKTR